MDNQLTISSRLDETFFNRFFLQLEDSPATVTTYKRSLKQFMLWLGMQADASQPTPDTIRRYKQDLEASGKKPATRALYLTVVKSFFKFCRNEGLYPDITAPVKGVKVDHQKPHSYFNADQVKHILGAIDTSTREGKRNHAMLLLMFSCGLRTIEISRASVSDLKRLGSTYVLMVQGKGHNDKDDFVPVPDAVRAVLGDYVQTCKLGDADPLFPNMSSNSRGQALTTRSIRRICKQAFISAGYDDQDLTAHSTRHTTAILSLKANGHNVYYTQSLLRHRDPATTERYLHQIDREHNQSADLVANEILGG
ncbi:tyrosine-type recombinase/integrase [Lactobacillus delbrueckii subsp. bulgaricus]|nr:hypothetical protein [Lactobacillus delbrueckii subsp. bulgaricus]